MRKLLNKYYEGLTTEEEEKRLRNEILTEELPDVLSADKDYFQGMDAAVGFEEQLPEGFSERLEAMIDREAEKVDSPKVASAKRNVIRRMLIWTGGVAAAVCLAFLTIVENGEGSMRRVSYIVEVDDPQLAREYTEMALEKFDNAFGQLVSKMDKAEKCIRECAKWHP